MKKVLEEKLAKLKPKRQDFIPEKFIGKGGKGYILKNWVVHRGPGAPSVSKEFKEVVRLTGTPKEYQLNKNLRLRMKYGGPRYATMGNPKKMK